jgi:hypothetical protein
MDEASLERGESIRLDELKSFFRWEPAILRLLEWVRLRHRELKAVIEDLGGSIAIARNVRQALEEPQPITKTAPSIPQESPRKWRNSSGRDRRRSGRKFDPQAELDLRAIDVLKAKERDSGVHLGFAAVQHVAGGEVQDEQPERDDQAQDEQQTMVGSDTASQQEREEIFKAVKKMQKEQPMGKDQESELQVAIESDGQRPEEEHSEEQQLQQQPTEEQVEESQAPGPPQSSAALLKALKAVPKPQKENRPVSIFDRQTSAQRIEFGDGFDNTQPIPDPSNIAKGKQPAAPSPRKRSRPADSDDSGSDAFETQDRGLLAPERRRNAPVAKRQRTTEPIPSSSAPPSHQPPPRPTPRPRPSSEQEESVSEVEAPEMMEEFPLSSTWRDQRRLAKENRVLDSTRSSTERKAREAWSNEEEEALIEYMRLYPSRYSKILQYDEQGPRVLQNRNQVNLKDKARNLALNMIRYFFPSPTLGEL